MALPDTFGAFILWGVAWLLAGFFFGTGMALSRKLFG